MTSLSLTAVTHLPRYLTGQPTCRQPSVLGASE